MTPRLDTTAAVFDTTQVAAMSGAALIPNDVARLCARGVFPNAVRYGNRWLIPAADVAARLDAAIAEVERNRRNTSVRAKEHRDAAPDPPTIRQLVMEECGLDTVADLRQHKSGRVLFAFVCCLCGYDCAAAASLIQVTPEQIRQWSALIETADKEPELSMRWQASDMLRRHNGSERAKEVQHQGPLSRHGRRT